MQGFTFDEKYLSQIPAIQQLINLGFEYLTPGQAMAERQGRSGNILLEGILRERLRANNRIYFKGQEYLFSEENIQAGIQKLKNIKYDGLQKTGEVIFDLITLGAALEQTINGDSRSFNLKYIDWQNWKNNRFQVTSEFSVDRSRSNETIRIDIVLFVNGIPFTVIECKSPDIEVEEAVKQCIRNQKDDYSPRFFTYVQKVLGINKNKGLYATIGTPAKLWSTWQEKRDSITAVKNSITKSINPSVKENLYSGQFAPAREYFDSLESNGSREITEQDKAIFSLCRPERLIELVYKFTVFDSGIKKIARYNQYFLVKSIIERVKTYDDLGRRRGGMNWQSQGSGKSLSMVFLTRCLALDPEIPNARIVLVTDRVDLDKQLGNTFQACGFDANRAKTGRDLLELLSEKSAGIVTTLIHKFEKALNVRNFRDESKDIFVLVDESHRTNFGSFAARMRQTLANACYLGFTGTPLIKKEKNSFVKFGALIEPAYSIQTAVKDGAVVPLLYEGRHVEMEQNKAAIDLWFERHTQGLTREQKADLKRKYARAEMLNKADQVIYMRAFDISEHYRANWQGTGFKAQLVAPSKLAAIKYRDYLNEIGYVSSEVIISPPDVYEGTEEVYVEDPDDVGKFWKEMMQRYGSEEEYNKNIVDRFKFGEEPEVLIVVDKLLTGFDAPRNTVLYLCRKLQDHSLLQAIGRVNRLFSDEEKGMEKEYGYIVDYVSILGELDRALNMYSDAGLDQFDAADLEGTLISINREIAALPQLHSDLWDLFKEIKNQQDEEAFELLLADKNLREEFYSRWFEYARVLKMAFSTERFIMHTPESRLRQYTDDLKRFLKLKNAIKLRYAESIDYRDYELKIKKLLDTHIQANEVIKLNKPVNIFDEKTFSQVKEDHGLYDTRTPGAKADAIAHATKKAITEKMDEDPAFYEKFSKLIQQAIDDFRAKRITDLEYLNTVTSLSNKVVKKVRDNIPQNLVGNEDALAFYGILSPFFKVKVTDQSRCEEISSDASLAIQEIIKRNQKVNFWDDTDAQKRTIDDIDDYLFDEVKGKRNITLSPEEMDDIIAQSMRLARNRRIA